MKIAFVGKGGSGKTTLTSLFVRHLRADPTVSGGLLAIDADINQHLATALGGSATEAAALPTLGANLPLIKDHLRGANPRIPDTESMIKTTPPGTGSRLIRVAEDTPIHAACVREVGGIPLAVTGPFAEADLGVACYHSKVGAVELLLNHLADRSDDHVVVDMTAGADSFASGLFTRFDLTFLVCEPTLRGVGVYRQYVGHARDFGVRVMVVGNKVADAEDEAFLRERVGDDLVACVGRSEHVRASERGDTRPIETLEPENLAALRTLRELAGGTERDWAAYQADGVRFHLRNAAAWGNARTGTDLAAQVDPSFDLGAAVAAAVAYAGV